MTSQIYNFQYTLNVYSIIIFIANFAFCTMNKNSSRSFISVNISTCKGRKWCMEDAIRSTRHISGASSFSECGPYKIFINKLCNITIIYYF